MNSNGMQIFPRAYNATSTSAQPCLFAVQIGRGLKGTSLYLYKSTGKSTSGELDKVFQGSTESKGFTLKSYNELTGILILDCGYQDLATITVARFDFSDVTQQTSGYLVINASKNPALTGLNVGTVFASYNQSSAQSITSSSDTVIDFSTKVVDTHSAVTTGGSWLFTAPEAGVYQISSSIEFASASFVATAVAVLMLFKNGTQVAATEHVRNTALTQEFAAYPLVYAVSCVKGDTLQLKVFQNNGSSRSLRASDRYNFVTITKVSVG